MRPSPWPRRAARPSTDNPSVSWQRCRTDAGTPGGTVTFADGAARLATVPLDGSGTATFTTSVLSLGCHSITATYSGDADFLGVQSAPYSETVAQTGTEVVVVENSVFKNKKLMSVRLTAEIKPLAPGGGVPTGEVTFELVTTTTKKKVKVTTLGTVAVRGGEATLTLKANKLPQKGITIVYSGDANDKASTVTTTQVDLNPTFGLPVQKQSFKLLPAKTTASGRVTRRASSDPACFSHSGQGLARLSHDIG